MKRNAFCILAVARSGTNFFVSRIENHNRVLCHYEPFNKNKIHLSGKIKQLPEDSLQKLSDENFRNDHTEAYFDNLIGNSPLYWNTKFKSIGFKYLYGHMDVLDKIFQQKDMKVFVLERRNRLKSYSSLLIAHKTKQWWAKEAGKDQAQIVFEKDKFQHYTNYVDNFYSNAIANLEKNGMDYQHLYYSDFTNPSFDYDKILEQLDVDPAEKLSVIRQMAVQNSSNVLDRFKNPDTVVNFLTDNQKELYLES